MANEIQIADKPTLDEINNKVGTNVDAGGSNSLFARLAQIKENIDSPKAMNLFIPGSFITSQISWQTALNITGKGVLKGIGIKVASNHSAFCKVTIDGNVIIHSKMEGTTGALLKKNWFIYPQDGTAAMFGSDVSAVGDMNFSFNQSLKIELYSDNADYETSVFWFYAKEV